MSVTNGVQGGGDEAVSKFDTRFRTFVESFVQHFESKLDHYYRVVRGSAQKESKRYCVLEVLVGGVGYGIGAFAGAAGPGGTAGRAAGRLLGRYLATSHHKQRAERVLAGLGRAASEATRLRATLVETAAAIFRAYEAQLASLEAEQGVDVALHLLAVDAVERIVDHNAEDVGAGVASDLLARAFLHGRPKPRLPSLSAPPRVALWGAPCELSKLYDKVGVLKSGERYYKKGKTDVAKAARFGCRLLFGWEDPSGLEELAPGVKTPGYAHVLGDEEVAGNKMVEALAAINDKDPDFKTDEIRAGVREIRAINGWIVDKLEEIGADLTGRREAVPSGPGGGIAFETRKAVDRFEGREALLRSDLVEALGASKMAALVGPAGTGKREAARMFAARHRASYGGNVAWIDCSTRGNATSALGRLAGRLPEVDTEPGDLPASVRTVHAHYRDRRCLFVFADVADLDEVRDLVPPGRPHVLLTSRDLPSDPDVHPIPLDALAEEEALSFVRAQLDACKESDLTGLVATLRCLPLALEMTVAYLGTVRGLDLADHVDALRAEIEASGGDVLCAVTSVSLRAMRRDALGEGATRVLEVGAFLSSEELPRKILSNLLAGDDDERGFDKEERDRTAGLLVDYSLASRSPTNPRAVVVRSQVGDVVRRAMSTERRACVLRTALVALRGVTAEAHILSVWGRAADHPELVSDFVRSVYGGEGDTVLHLVARNGSLSIARKVVENIVDTEVRRECVGARNKSDNTALHLACKHGFLDVTKYLEECDEGGLAAKNKMARTPLHEAIVRGQLQVVRHFAERLDLRARSVANQELLCWAAAGGRLSVLRYLVEEKGAELRTRGPAPRLPLHKACRGADKMAAVRYLTRDCDVDATDDAGNTALHWAARRGNVEVVRHLVGDKMADVGVRNAQGDTPAHVATAGGHLEVVRYLTTREGWAGGGKRRKGGLLHVAAWNRRLKVVEFLVGELGMSVHARDPYGNTPLHEAARGGSVEVVRYLVGREERGVHEGNSHGKTPLHRAAAAGRPSVVRYLVEDCKASVCGGDGGGNTPLHEATYGGSVEVVRYLVMAGANVEATNKYNRTPLFGAIKKPHYEVMQYLVGERGCRIDVTDYKGTTPLQVASIKNNRPAVDYLQARMKPSPQEGPLPR